MWGESSGKLLSWSFIPPTSHLLPQRMQAASTRCVSCPQSFQEPNIHVHCPLIHVVSLLTPLALYPRPLCYTDGASEAWATLSSSYSYTVIALLRPVTSFQSIFIYLYSLCFIIAVSCVLLFLKCIPDPFSSCGG